MSERKGEKMREFHVSWMTKDEDGYHGHWVHIPGTNRREVGRIAERDLRANGVELVRNGAGTYVAVENGTRNCRH